MNNMTLRPGMVYLEILAYMPILTHCQLNENPCSNQEIHVQFEHWFKLENTSNMPRVMT